MSGIREQIVRNRKMRVARDGHALGDEVPAARRVPLVPFLREPPIICEIKRRSPSRGDIAAELDPVAQAHRYAERGVRSLSVLTEEDYFSGSLGDLIAVKEAHPELAVLRKDFLLDVEDIEVSHRAGADAVLLIASILTGAELAELHGAAGELGMAALVEVHDQPDIEKARSVRPDLVGINARDLTTFAVDLLTPMRLRHLVDWKNRTVFESGVFTREHGRLVASGGFAGLLVGEAVVREPERIPEIVSGYQAPAAGVAAVHPTGAFWPQLAGRKRPLVKICGITNREDAELAVALGADILGFVLADSPRRTTAEAVRELADLDVLKAAVVVSGGKHGPLLPEVQALLREGAVDVIQFHGDEEPADCESGAFPYYRAVRLGSTDDVPQMVRFGSPRVLVDARARHAYGGTGKRLSAELAAAAAEQGPLWLAGGINDLNVGKLIRACRPELIDASSGLEREPGRKDHARLRRFFRVIERETNNG